MSSLEIPVFRLGLAGFSAEQEELIMRAANASRLTQWQCGAMAGADAWVVNGQFTQHLGGGRIRVASRRAGARSIQLQLSETQRPVAFAAPLPGSLQGTRSFHIDEPASVLEAIGVFEFALAPLAAQFLLAAHVVDQQEVLAAHAFEVRTKGQLIAVVDMRGDAAVLPSVRPANFDAAIWQRADRDRLRIPKNFARMSLSELMWRYTSRTSRDLLPARYRSGPIYFRRPPRVDPVLVDEQHLLIMRELSLQPCSLEELARRLDLAEDTLARALAALYYVGAITSTRSRAAPTTVAADLLRSRAASHYGELRTRQLPFEVTDLRDLTAPAPLVFA